MNLSLRFFVLLYSTVCLVSCKKPNDGPTDGFPKINNAKIELVSGDGQSGTYGDFLPDVITIKVTSPSGKPMSQYKLIYNFIQGNGTVSTADYISYPDYPNAAGIAKLKWSLGCNSETQKIKVYLYEMTVLPSLPGEKPSGLPDDSLTIQATGNKPLGWGKSCGCGELDQVNATIISRDKNTLYLINRILYYSIDGGINWSKLPNAPDFGNEVVKAQFNSKGWLYVLTRRKGAWYSKDLTSWQQIHNGSTAISEPKGFLVTDDLIMISYSNDGFYISKNNGNSWEQKIVSTQADWYYNIQQHPDGSLYLMDDDKYIWSSKDGAVWKLVLLDESYNAIRPEAFDIGPDGFLYITYGEAKLSRLSPITSQVTKKQFLSPSDYARGIGNIAFYNNDVFLIAGSPTKPSNLYSMNNNWGKIDIGYTTWLNRFFIQPDGKFILSDGLSLYYKN